MEAESANVRPDRSTIRYRAPASVWAVSAEVSSAAVLRSDSPDSTRTGPQSPAVTDILSESTGAVVSQASAAPQTAGRHRPPSVVTDYRGVDGLPEVREQAVMSHLGLLWSGTGSEAVSALRCAGPE